ncbi:protein meaA [Rhodospirillaceae bacterium AH-315-P19]|nr:protein meaA [Rhodospirillaceae bacterium AH-315-P19]
MTKTEKQSSKQGSSNQGGEDAASANRGRPWLFRTYSGHSSAAASNALYRTNLARGQTGLSIAFDLPTQTGYDSDRELARGEVGKVGVPISHLGDMETLFEDIPLDRMNTSMTINATAPWLLALYIAAAEKQGHDRSTLSGTVQNDLVKEYLSRGTYIFPPGPSIKLTSDVISFTYREMPKWNPVNVCSYHLQEAGATPVQELAFALATACAVLDAVRDSGQVPAADFPKVVGRISFFVNAGIRFITEMCKMRAFVDLWDEITRERYGVEDPKFRRFRYGVQVNSLGLTEQQPENNVYRILLEMLAVVLSKDARARAVQLPAWNEALGLPRPWDQQWSLRLQQIMAYETDLLEYEDIFNGSPVIDRKVEELKTAAREEFGKIEELGGVLAGIEAGYMKQRMVESNNRRIAEIESGERVVVGVNRYEEASPSPLMAGGDGGYLTPDSKAEEAQIARLRAWRDARDDGAVAAALEELRSAAEEGRNVMIPSIACAHAGVTTGEWGGLLREVFGEYRAPTGVQGAVSVIRKPADFQRVRERVEAVSKKLGQRIKFLVGKPGLDGHSSGAEQLALRARDAGMEVIYEGIRLTPAQIVVAAVEEGVHVIGLSILSGSHLALVESVLEQMREAGIADVPLIVGGIIPPEDAKQMKDMGVARVYTPKDYDFSTILEEIAELVGESHVV